MGTMRAHGNSRGLMTHGSKSHRLQGSIELVHHQDVFSREKMSDVIAWKKRTISGLEIIDIDTKENLLVKGSFLVNLEI
jgi:large subunit ribosomal protein L3